MVQCVVCGKEIDEERWASLGAYKEQYQDGTYFTCGFHHKAAFWSNPDRYVQGTGARPGASHG